jgi:hypothetical protein
MQDQALATDLTGRPATTIDAADAAYATVVTRLRFAASPAQVWNGLMFYEQIERKPPFYLRWLLPVPIRTEGKKSVVGDEALCLYVGGHLIKRVTRVERGSLYAFSVVEQQLDVGGGMKLSNGSYELRALPDGGTEVSVMTRYLSRRAPRWLWKRIEAQVCHIFHRHILRAMRAEIDGR